MSGPSVPGADSDPARGGAGERARLFTAVRPSREAVAALRAELDRVPSVEGRRVLRWTTVQQWHITLGFYGTDDPDARTEWLRPRLAGLGSRTVRLSGAGSFRGVLWIGVAGAGLGDLAAAVRPPDEERDFHAHLTLARGDVRAAIERWRRHLADVDGPEWTVTEVELMRSDPGGARGSGPRYSTVERFPLQRG